MPRRATQEDIARAAGVSRSAVAKALTLPAERSEIAPATRRRILDAARALGYQGGSPRTVCLVGGEASAWQDPFLPGALAALTAAAHPVHLRAWPVASGDLRGIAVLVAVAFLPAELPRLAAREGLRCLALNGAGDGALAVRPDEAADMAAAVEHLAGLGHRHLCFAFATGIHPHFSVAERRRAAAEAALRLGLRLEEQVLNHGEDDLLRLMTSRGGPTALILAPMETHPWRVVEARRQRPFALVVIGQDQRNSPLSSIQPDYAEVGRRLAVTCACAGGDAPALVPGRLVARDTSVPPP